MRILLLDELSLVRETLRMFLDTHPDCEVVASCADVFEAIRYLRAAHVDLVVLGDEPASDSASRFLRLHLTENLPGKIVCLARIGTRLDLAAALEGRAQGIVLKRNPPNVLLTALRRIHSGETYFDPTLKIPAMEARDPKSNHPFSERERDVVGGVVDGLTNKEIADRLGTSEVAIKASLQLIFGKTGVRSRAQLVRLALERSLA